LSARVARVLVADDDRLVRAIFGDALRRAGHEVVTAADGREALARLEGAPFDLLLTDLLMPEMDGLELLEQAKRHWPELDVVVLTSVGTAEPAVRALRGGALHYLVKPVDPEALVLEIHRCLENRRLLEENAELRRWQALLSTGQRITACLELERLTPLAVDALGHQFDAEVTLLVRPSLAAPASPEARGFELLGVRGLPAAEAQTLMALVWGALGTMAESAVEPVAVDDLGAGWPATARALRHLEHGLIVPLRRDGALGAVALLFRVAAQRPFTARHARDAAFLGESIALALENAERYVQARLVAHLDALTGLFNGRHLEHVVEREIRTRRATVADAESPAPAPAPFSLLFMDLDHFKRVNDTHGHLVGSRVIVEMARLLRRQTRETDVLVRYGGDEFVALLPGAGTEEALRVAERIRAAVEAHRFLSREGLELRLTLCCGVCTWPEHAETPSDVIHRADLAMYHGKKSHRNAVYLYDALPAGSAAEPSMSIDLLGD
jgi:diguanylate cyclase (GGDEF)-like protein